MAKHTHHSLLLLPIVATRLLVAEIAVRAGIVRQKKHECDRLAAFDAGEAAGITVMK